MPQPPRIEEPDCTPEHELADPVPQLARDARVHGGRDDDDRHNNTHEPRVLDRPRMKRGVSRTHRVRGTSQVRSEVARDEGLKQSQPNATHAMVVTVDHCCGPGVREAETEVVGPLAPIVYVNGVGVSGGRQDYGMSGRSASGMQWRGNCGATPETTHLDEWMRCPRHEWLDAHHVRLRHGG